MGPHCVGLGIVEPAGLPQRYAVGATKKRALFGGIQRPSPAGGACRPIVNNVTASRLRAAIRQAQRGQRCRTKSPFGKSVPPRPGKGRAVE